MRPAHDEAVLRARSSHPDVVVFDVRLPNRAGVVPEATARVLDQLRPWQEGPSNEGPSSLFAQAVERQIAERR